MKKILLSALFYGFVLNNGCCFDAHHKITNEYLDGLFYRLIDENIANRIDALVMHKRNEFTFDLDWVIRSGVEWRLASGLDSFLKRFLNTVIPYGKNKGKTVKNLLIEGKLYRDTMMTICDYAVSFEIVDREVRFHIADLGTITVYPPASNDEDSFDISLAFLPLRETVRVK